MTGEFRPHPLSQTPGRCWSCGGPCRTFKGYGSGGHGWRCADCCRRAILGSTRKR